MSVLNDQHAAIFDVRNTFFRRDDLLLVCVTAIIKHNIDISSYSYESAIHPTVGRADNLIPLSRVWFE